MEEIKVYKLTDGRLIEDKSDAIYLQKLIYFEDAVENFFSIHGLSSTGNTFLFIKEHIDEIRNIVNILNPDVEEETFCEWTIRDVGTMGFKDMVYETSCGKEYDQDKIERGTYCPNCGKKTK